MSNQTRKGIILAGGTGSRLHPLTLSVSKQLMPVYDKPMIYYPLSILILAGISDILVISTPQDTPRFESLLGDGSRLGISLSYEIQASPDGLAQAFIIAESFLAGERCAMILGDNIFYGTDLEAKLVRARQRKDGATVFAYAVSNPERYGVVVLDDDEQPLSLQEKPSNPTSRHAVTGLYFYDASVVDMAKSLKPSSRGELEITDINKLYLEQNSLNVEVLGRGTAWFDTGTQNSLLAASNFVETIESRQGYKVCCPEEIAFYKGYISAEQLREIATPIATGDYGAYLLDMLKNA